ncbi:uncharacterized protein LOC34624159 [Cyclospora cayetanensis]|uniref:Uncharacterized protein LOC34624159 n=2 Tax=Cyclospora cayetanensis TaxID=88456 RepID=A0A6P5WEE1_9EIME|nr:uncharacterized protein LOC34624159 [Cyclospora cayetanensis]OEH80358.1 hypothetical protein cyc_08429 [Cyclospora cayetanensis]
MAVLSFFHPSESTALVVPAAKLRTVSQHLHHQEILDSSGIPGGPPEAPQNEASRASFFSLQGSGRLLDSRRADTAFVEAHARSEAGAARPDTKKYPAVSCQISFHGHYDEPPMVQVKAEAPLDDAVTAIFVDESSRFWVHGLQGNVKVPSNFTFGAEGTEGDYADIHPPAGTGKHRYTVILYSGVPHLGPRLSSLAGTPWNNRDRAVESLKVIEDDLKKENGQHPEELCRCSVEVSDEDIQNALVV